MRHSLLCALLLLGLSSAFALRLSTGSRPRQPRAVARIAAGRGREPLPAERVRRPAIKLASIVKPNNENSGPLPKATRPKSLQREKQQIVQVKQAKSGAGDLMVKILAIPLSLARATRNSTVNKGISPEEDMAAAAEAAADVVKVGVGAAISWNFVIALAKAAATVTAAATVGPVFKLIGAAGALSMVSDNATAAVGAQNYSRKIWVNGTHYTYSESRAEALRALAASAETVTVIAATSAELEEEKEERALGGGLLPDLEEDQEEEQKAPGNGLLPERWRHQPIEDEAIRRERPAEDGSVASSTSLQDKCRSQAADAEPSVVWGVAPLAVPLQDQYRSQAASMPSATPTPAVASGGSPSVGAPGGEAPGAAPDAAPVAMPSMAARPSIGEVLLPPPAMRKALLTQKAFAMRALLGYLGTATLGTLVLGSGYAALAGPSAALSAARRLAPKIVASSAALAISVALGWRGWAALRSASRPQAGSLSNA